MLIEDVGFFQFFFRVIMLETLSGETEKEIVLNSFTLVEKERRKKFQKLFGKPPNRFASTNVHKERREIFPSIYLCCYRYLNSLLSVPSPQCHWILKIWRHLDCSPRIIFRFQLIYHCREWKETFSRSEISVSSVERMNKEIERNE